jgi:hypothetical protein
MVKMVISKTSMFYHHAKSESDFLNGDMPPLIGCLISDKDGKSIFTFELFTGAIQQYIRKSSDVDDKECDLDLDLIPMYTSAIEMLTSELNVHKVPGLEVSGTNLKLHILFCLEKFTIVLFLNPKIKFDFIEEHVTNYFINLFEEFSEDFNDIKKYSSKDFVDYLERLSWCWLIELNENYSCDL